MSSNGALLKGQVALVTGASRGIGRGIAVELGRAGATVYVTGRQPAEQSAASPLQLTAEQITANGGHGIAVYCDHSKDAEVEDLFQKIADEQNGQLDILVNNAYSAVMDIAKYTGVKFYEIPLDIFDRINNVGLRNHYICTALAARLMAPRGRGLIVTVSSAGGAKYLFNSAYGVGKAACDRLAADTATELKDSNVCHVSLWPGYVATETVLALKTKIESIRKAFSQTETPEFSGKCVVALASDPNVIAKTGKILLNEELSEEYGLLEDSGEKPPATMTEVVKAYVKHVNQTRTSDI